MLDYLLLFIAIVTYFYQKWRFLSILLYIGFMFEGYNLYNGLAFYSLKNIDLAVVYTFVVNCYLILNSRYKLPKMKFLKWYYIFIIFIFLSAIYSHLHYNLSWIEILQGGRYLLLVFSLPIMYNLTCEDALKILRGLYWITVITGIIYILQVIMQCPIFLQHSEPEPDGATGLLRFYDYPPFITFFLAYSFIYPSFFKNKLTISRIIFILCVLASLGRTFILVNLITVVFALFLQGKFQRLLKHFVLGLILLLPFYNIIQSRFNDGNTVGDLTSIISGDFQTYTEYHESGTTMTYRLAWVYERFDYLMQRPFSERFFGLGLLSDDLPKSKQMYDFKIRIIFPNITMQLRTPDIAYGTMIAYMGIGGIILYMILYCSLMSFFYKNKHRNSVFILGAVMLVSSLLIGFAGDNISNPQYLSPYFLLLSFYKVDVYGGKRFNLYSDSNV